MKLSETTSDQIRAIAAGKGCRLLAIESAGAGRYSVVRVVLERENGEGASIGDCEAVSREVSAVLDTSDEIPHRYSLEVSSAGLERRLYSLEDAERFTGRVVRVKTESPVLPDFVPGRAGRGRVLPARNFAGMLQKVEGDRLTVVDEAEGKIYNVRFGDIRTARLDFSWPKR
jgi:ribosome maturation factor RimP